MRWVSAAQDHVGMATSSSTPVAHPEALAAWTALTGPLSDEATAWAQETFGADEAGRKAS